MFVPPPATPSNAAVLAAAAQHLPMSALSLGQLAGPEGAALLAHFEATRQHAQQDLAVRTRPCYSFPHLTFHACIAGLDGAGV